MGFEGGHINLVPVDFVAAALDTLRTCRVWTDNAFT